MVARAYFDSLRSLAFGSISASYAAVGSSFTKQVRAIRITNNTEGDMIFSDDSSNSNGQIFVPAQSFVLWDLQANINPQFDDKYVLPIGTQIYVKQVSAPVSGSVYIECIY